MERRIISTQKFPALSYKVAGEGEALVLLHGFPLDGAIWDQVVPELSKQYLVIVPDIPGCGNSTFSGDDLSIEEIAESVMLILEQEQVEKAVIAGHSMGGYAALAFAELYPENIAGLGLIHSFATPDNEEKKEQRRKSIELFKKGGKEPFIRQMIPVLFAESSKTVFSEAIEHIKSRALLTYDISLIAFYNAMINRPDRTSILNNQNLRVLWVIGGNDTIATTKNLMQQTSLSNVNFVYVYSNCGHMCMIEEKDRLISDLISFTSYCYNTTVSNYVE